MGNAGNTPRKDTRMQKERLMAEVLIQSCCRTSPQHPPLLCTEHQIKNQANEKRQLPTVAQLTQRLVKSTRGNTNHLKILKQTVTGLIVVVKRAVISGFTLFGHIFIIPTMTKVKKN